MGLDSSGNPRSVDSVGVRDDPDSLQARHTAMTMLEQEDKPIRTANTFHFAQGLDGIRKRAGGERRNHCIETSIRKFKFLCIHGFYLYIQIHKRGFLLRDLSAVPQLGQAVRVTLGTPEQNDRLLASLAP